VFGGTVIGVAAAHLMRHFTNHYAAGGANDADNTPGLSQQPGPLRSISRRAL
jgi:predicted exporter